MKKYMFNVMSLYLYVPGLFMLRLVHYKLIFKLVLQHSKVIYRFYRKKLLSTYIKQQKQS